jgi:hypothetical protein
MGLFDQSQGLMGLGQPQRNRAQGTEVNGQFVPTFSNPDGSYMSEGGMVNPQQPQGNMPPRQPIEQQPFNMPQNPNLGGALKNILGGNFNPTITTQPTDFSQNDASLPQNIQDFLKKDRAGSVMDAGEGWSYDPTTQSFNSNTRNGSQTKSLAEMQNYVNGQGQTTALSPYPNAMQSAVAQTTANPMQQMNVGNQTQQIQQQNPVNTQTVQPNFMGQTPFGQPQTSQFTSTNPFVQAAQANAQGNLGGALQATSANRVNQQTPYGSLSYQQTGTDAQGNPIWSANQQLSPELQQLTQSSLAGLQASQANPMYGINPGDTYSNAIMQRLAPQQSQAREALDAQLANQGIMPGSEAYNRAKVLQGQTQNDALTSAIVGGMQTGLQAQGLQNTTAANIRNLATPGYVTPYNQAAVAGPDYLSAYTSQNATDIARANAEAAQRSSLLSTLGGLGSSAILGGTGANSALGGLLGLGNQGLTALGNSSLWSQLFGGTTAKAPLTDFSPGTSVLNVSPEFDPQAYGLL